MYPILHHAGTSAHAKSRESTKQQGQASPYRHLLKPKAGALALTLGAMGGQFHSMLDVTIVYPAGAPDFWSFLCGRVPRIVVRVRPLPIPPDFSRGDYTQDRAFRRAFHRWLEAIWEFKDQEIDALLGCSAVSPVQARLQPSVQEQPCSGYWHGHLGRRQVAAPTTLVQEVAYGAR
ncbi:MAG: hypothetical protein ABJA49_05075 [Betaproteobacteria bacterium]